MRVTLGLIFFIRVVLYAAIWQWYLARHAVGIGITQVFGLDTNYGELAKYVSASFTMRGQERRLTEVPLPSTKHLG